VDAYEEIQNEMPTYRVVLRDDIWTGDRNWRVLYHKFG
jgi:hypothetical protein